MVDHIAILDFGTNTFNLSIYTVVSGKINAVIYQKSIPVKLKEGGWNDGYISQERFDLGIKAAKEHAQTIKEYGISKLKAIGTEGLRIAKNSEEFLSAVYNETGIQIKIISGDQEAEYIYQGVMKYHEILGNVLIMDIGGGSVEFILADKNEIFWKKSIPIGASKLKAKFHQTDIISSENVLNLREWVNSHLQEVYEKARFYAIDTLVGTSGSFETIYDIINYKNGKSFESLWDLYPIAFNDFKILHQSLAKMSLSQRMKVPGMTPFRADMMVVSMCLINEILANIRIHDMLLARTAIKEGVAVEVLDSSDISS